MNRITGKMKKRSIKGEIGTVSPDYLRYLKDRVKQAGIKMSSYAKIE